MNERIVDMIYQDLCKRYVNDGQRRLDYLDGADEALTKCEKLYEHELALARASATYWREKYIEKLNRQRLMERKVSDLYGPNYVNALYWFERAARSPIDECDE